MSLLPLQPRESFFRDPFFDDTWAIMERGWSDDFRKEIEEMRKRFQTIMKRSFEDVFVTPKSLFENMKEFSTLPITNELQTTPDKFQVCVSTEGFQAPEISVKSVDDTLVIEAKHEEKSPNSFVGRQIYRKFTIPPDVKPEQVQCNLSSDGMLVIEAPRQNVQKAITHNETKIPIEHMGRPAITSNGHTNGFSKHHETTEKKSSLTSNWASPFGSKPNHGMGKEHKIDIRRA